METNLKEHFAHDFPNADGLHARTVGQCYLYLYIIEMEGGVVDPDAIDWITELVGLKSIQIGRIANKILNEIKRLTGFAKISELSPKTRAKVITLLKNHGYIEIEDGTDEGTCNQRWLITEDGCKILRRLEGLNVAALSYPLEVLNDNYLIQVIISFKAKLLLEAK